MLGECQDKDMKSMYIERHNAATRLIVAEVLKGNAGNCIVCADVGKEAKVAHLAINHTRVPESIISKHTLGSLGLAAENRDKLRPDALIIECLPQETIEDVLGRADKRDAQGRRKLDKFIHDPKSVTPYRPRKAYIIEVGYGAETRYQQKLQEKDAQHSQLRSLLRAEGFADVTNPIILGTTGGIFQNQKSLLSQLGVAPDRQKRLNCKLHAHAISFMHGLIKLRRLKEAGLTQSHVPKRKKPPDK